VKCSHWLAAQMPLASTEKQRVERAIPKHLDSAQHQL
jgi:hypothetical protein